MQSLFKSSYAKGCFQGKVAKLGMRLDLPTEMARRKDLDQIDSELLFSSERIPSLLFLKQAKGQFLTQGAREKGIDPLQELAHLKAEVNVPYPTKKG